MSSNKAFASGCVLRKNCQICTQTRSDFVRLLVKMKTLFTEVQSVQGRDRCRDVKALKAVSVPRGLFIQWATSVGFHSCRIAWRHRVRRGHDPLHILVKNNTGPCSFTKAKPQCRGCAARLQPLLREGLCVARVCTCTAGESTVEETPWLLNQQASHA